MTLGEQEKATGESIRKVIRNGRRRYVLYYLNQNGGVAHFNELVERVTSWETESTSEGILNRKRESVYSSLYQTHLPKLENMGLVSHDTINGTVSLTDRGEQISVYCAADTLETTIPSYAVGLAGVVLSLLFVGRLGLISSHLTLTLSIVGITGLVLFLLRRAKAGIFWRYRYEEFGPDYMVEIEDK